MGLSFGAGAVLFAGTLAAHGDAAGPACSAASRSSLSPSGWSAP